MKNILLLSILFFSISACQLMPCLTVESFVSSSLEANKKFESEQKSFTDEQWKSMDSQYRTFLEDCYPKFKKELSTDELKTFWLHTSEYFIKRSYKGPDMEESLKELYSKNFKLYMEEIGSKYAKMFKELINVNIDDTVEKVFDFLKGFGE